MTVPIRSVPYYEVDHVTIRVRPDLDGCPFEVEFWDGLGKWLSRNLCEDKAQLRDFLDKVFVE